MAVLTGSIDVTKIDKSKLFEGKEGAKYLNIAIIETPSSEYNTHMIVQSLTKEEREKGLKGEILGGIKKWNNNEQGTNSNNQTESRESEELPF